MGPVWFSHRGVTERATENTFESFSAAVALGFQGLETDLRVTRDDHLVLMHDATFDRVAGDVRDVRALSRVEIAGIRLKGGERPLFFDELAESFRGVSWILDLKPEGGDRAVHALATLLGRMGRAFVDPGTIRFLAWRSRHEALIRRLIPGSAGFYARRGECWRAGLSALAGVPAIGGIEPGRIYALVPRLGRIRLYRPELVERFRRRGARIISFLPGSAIDIQAAVEAGLDEILIDGRIPDDARGAFPRG